MFCWRSQVRATDECLFVKQLKDHNPFKHGFKATNGGKQFVKSQSGKELQVRHG